MGLKLTTEETDDTIAASDMRIGQIGAIVGLLNTGRIVIRIANDRSPLVLLDDGDWFTDPLGLRVRLLKPGTTLTVC